jgi:ubiquinone/menaquinone biosynthesis C-methylase UbiE
MTHPYKCIECSHTPLRHRGDAYSCSQCGAKFRVVFGVPLLLKNLEIAPATNALDFEVSSAICQATGVAADKKKHRILQQILSYNYRLPTLHLAAENNYFLSRIPLPEHLRKSAEIAGCSNHPVNEDVRYRIIDHLLPDALPCATLSTRNVRLENIGTSTISSKTKPPVLLAYHWRTPAGALVVYDGERTILPIDLLPGRAITIPTVIRTPAYTGPHMLELCLVHEGVSWLEGDKFTVGVEIVKDSLTTPAHWVQIAGGAYEYAEDHEKGRARLKAEVERRHHAGMRILELGGCCNPMARGLDADVYIVDIDIQTLQVGQMVVTNPGERLHFVAADAYDLPFADGSFDAITMFATLHHFAHPGEVLTRLKRLLKRDGFMAIMCEPCGTYLHGLADPSIVRELEHGINEQVFTLEEYHHLFQRAGLYSTWTMVEGTSFKSILQLEAPPTPVPVGLETILATPAA